MEQCGAMVIVIGHMNMMPVFQKQLTTRAMKSSSKKTTTQVPTYAKHFVKQIDPPFDLHFPSHARGIRATIGSAHLALEENMVLFIVRESPTEMQPDELPGGIENVFSTLIIT